MALTKFITDVENISNLSDLPNSIEGLTSAELKELFDKAGVDIKSFLNNSLIGELDTALAKSFTVTFPSGETTYELSTQSYNLSASTNVICQPADGYEQAWVNSGIKCSAVASNKITFTATTAPSSNVVINVLVMN